MKAQIITIESHDDLISVRDRMSWAKSPRILLVWPKFEKVSLRAVDLRILQQHATYLGADMGVVTRRGDIRRDAEGFGIPVFESTIAAQRNPWPARRPPRADRLRRSEGLRPGLRALGDTVKVKEAQWRSGPVARVVFFGIGVLAVLTIAALFVPRANIKIEPISTKQSVSLPVTAGTSIHSVVITGSVPAQETTVTVSGTQSAQVTSQGSIPQNKARGIARFKNVTESDLSIPAGTVVYSLSPTAARFVTLNDTHLAGNVNAIVEVPIEAVEPGATSNLPANSIQAIDGSVGLSASVTNPQPTTGGSDRIATVPSADDRKRVHDVLIGLLTAQAQKGVGASIGPRDLLLANTLSMGQVLEESYDPPAGQAGSLIQLTMKVVFSEQYVKADDLNQLAETTLNASIPPGFVVAADTLSFNLTNLPVLDGSGDSHFELQVQRTLHHELDLLGANALVRGLSPRVAAQVLRSRLPLANSPSIAMSPPWWPWLPLIPFRISFISQ